jgi:hypothetical protein
LANPLLRDRALKNIALTFPALSKPAAEIAKDLAAALENPQETNADWLSILGKEGSAGARYNVITRSQKNAWVAFHEERSGTTLFYWFEPFSEFQPCTLSLHHGWSPTLPFPTLLLLANLPNLLLTIEGDYCRMRVPPSGG